MCITSMDIPYHITGITDHSVHLSKILQNWQKNLVLNETLRIEYLIISIDLGLL